MSEPLLAAFEAGYRISRHWSAALVGRYDFELDRTARADLDLTYRNECVTVDLSLTRRYAAGDIDDPIYGFGVEVALAGFGEGDAQRFARSCRG